MKPPTLKFTNNCQLAVMRLDRLAKESSQRDDSLKHNDDQLCGGSSSQTTSSAPTEFLLNSAKSPSIGLSSLPSTSSPERKPPLACLFCRGRKIACGPPLPGSIRKTCKSVIYIFSISFQETEEFLVNAESGLFNVIIHRKADGE